MQDALQREPADSFRVGALTGAGRMDVRSMGP